MTSENYGLVRRRPVAGVTSEAMIRKHKHVDCNRCLRFRIIASLDRAKRGHTSPAACSSDLRFFDSSDLRVDRRCVQRDSEAS